MNCTTRSTWDAWNFNSSTQTNTYPLGLVWILKQIYPAKNKRSIQYATTQRMKIKRALKLQISKNSYQSLIAHNFLFRFKIGVEMTLLQDNDKENKLISMGYAWSGRRGWMTGDLASTRAGVWGFQYSNLGKRLCASLTTTGERSAPPGLKVDPFLIFTLIWSSKAVAIFVCWSINLFFSNNSGSEL